MATIVILFAIIFIIVMITSGGKQQPQEPIQDKPIREPNKNENRIQVIWASGGARGAMNVMINDEIGLALHKGQPEYIFLDNKTKIMTIDISWGGLYGSYRVGNVKEIERIEIKYKYGATIMFGVPFQFSCEVFYKNGTSTPLINKNANANDISYYQMRKAIG